MESAKICKKCRTEKPLIDGFYADKSKKDGRGSYCKECSSAVNKARYRVNPEKVKIMNAIWREANREKMQELTLEWRMANPEKHRANSARWAKDHPEILKANSARWAKRNPDKKNAAEHKRRAAKLAYGGEHYTVADIKVLLEQQQGRCLYCYDRLDTYHVDHVVPLSRGGGNGKENIALACSTCNTSKGAKLLGLEWIPPYRADATRGGLWP